MDKVNNALEDLVENLEKKHIRPLKREAFLCMAKCTENSSYSSRQLDGCESRCQDKLQMTSSLLQEELQGLSVIYIYKFECFNFFLIFS